MQVSSSVGGSTQAPGQGEKSGAKHKERLEDPFAVVFRRPTPGAALTPDDADATTASRPGEKRHLDCPLPGGDCTGPVADREGRAGRAESAEASDRVVDEAGGASDGRDGELPRLIDPLALQLGSAWVAAPSDPVPTVRTPLLAEAQAMQVVRRIAWGGDRRRGSVRIELGGPELAGTAILLEADGPAVRVALSAPQGLDARALGARVRARLERRGIAVSALEID